MLKALKIATCQFPIDADVAPNLAFVRRQLQEASRRGAHVVHFSETALSGYAGVEWPTLENYPWDDLESALREVMGLARKLRLWVVLGSMHRLARHKPHNSVYVIDDRGRIADRYDKLFCTGNPSGTKSDLRHYTPGDHFVTFAVRGWKCGVLICHDFRYPELARQYARLGTNVLFYSFHNGHFPIAKMRTKGRRFAALVPATMQAYASVNHQWISAANTSRRHSAWGGFTVQPDGMIAGRLQPGNPAVLVTRCEDPAKFDDAARSWRDRALRGILHSGKQVSDPRSRHRRGL
ncbi:MAG TPA: carbon-nitrogen hydrolase family protein [Lacunisphaera sp.]|nr:carbon-nitrogen hydrolase family protein [Lacunisphaera sp.]